MGFTLPADIEDYRRRVRVVVEQEITPFDADRAGFDERESIAEGLLQQLPGGVLMPVRCEPGRSRHAGVSGQSSGCEIIVRLLRCE